MDKWPLIYSRMLRKINEKNKEKLYYDIENDDIITENEIKERVEFSGNNRYRISKKYYIVGEKGLINNIYKTLNENKIPKIPEIILLKIERHGDYVMRKLTNPNITDEKFDNGRYVEYQDFKENKIWKPHVGNFVSIGEYNRSGHRYAYIISDISQNKSGLVNWATAIRIINTDTLESDKTVFHIIKLRRNGEWADEGDISQQQFFYSLYPGSLKEDIDTTGLY